jgi:hypothetical protein
MMTPQQCSTRLLNLDAIAHHPQFDLLKPRRPSILELLHPLAISRRIKDHFGQPARRHLPFSLNWRGSSTSYRRHLLLIGCLALYSERDVLIGEGF